MALLNRPSFACFHAVYDVTRTAGHPADDVPIEMSCQILAELAGFMLLAPLLEVEFDLPWAPARHHRH